MPIEIGLVNNMPDAALRSTERQIRSLLDRAGDGMRIRLTIYAFPEVPRSAAGAELARSYLDIAELWNSRPHGLIVTGTEPRAENLRDEPYWRNLTRLMEWAERETASSIWSCLAAHAALLHMDSIERRRLPEKRFGLFQCTPVSRHPLTRGLPNHIVMPHSRWNELTEADLAGAGYAVLTRSPEAGADMFVKQRRSLFVFFQGHPEYDADTLLLEYRRDIGRYLRGERQTYPNAPHGFGDRNLLDAFEMLRERALRERCEDVLASFPIALAAGQATNPWRGPAVILYRNWLQYLSARRAQLAQAI